MHPSDYRRPPQLHLYAAHADIQNALLRGQFRLHPGVNAKHACLTLSFAQEFSVDLCSQDQACLVINETERFGERLHAAVQKLLPNWLGIDGPVSYGQRSPLGELFTKAAQQAAQQEWLFAWRPMQAGQTRLQPILVELGNLESWGHVRERDTGSC